jgi:PAS domain S-box-containing protein
LPQVRGQAAAVALAILTALALAVNGRLAVSNVQRMTEAASLVSHSHQVLERLQMLLSSLQDCETGQRGFVITGKPEYLEPYETGSKAVHERLAELATLSSDDAVERPIIESFREPADAKLAELARTIELEQTGQHDAAVARVASGAGKRLMDQLRAGVDQAVAHERELLEARARDSADAARTTRYTSIAGAVASLLLLVGTLRSARRRLLEREQATSRLYEEKERFRTTLSSIGDAVMVTDTQGRITMINPTASALVGYENDSALGLPLEQVFKIVNEETRHTVESPVSKVLRDGQIAGLANHTVLVRRDGSEVPIDDSGAPIRDAAGTMVGVVLVFRDISERHATERELQHRSELLQEQDRRKDAFLVILSHELRNPLAPIRNAVAILQRTDPSGEQARRARDVIERQVGQMTRLVDDLLDLSRITEGKIRLNKELVSLRESLRRAVDDHRSLFAGKRIAFEFHEPSDPIWVEADLARLSQVMGNLLQNAAKFTNPDGHVAVSLGAQGSHALLRVRDDGAGMDRETLAKIFQPFMQAENTLARTQGGLGLGLALIKNLVELHGGTVAAASAGLGKGTEFTVTLPLAKSPAPAAETPAQLHPRSLRILVIEDNPDAANTLRDLLEIHGHSVQIARNGRQGLDLALAESPEVVLCDIGLPELDGYEVARRLREAGSRSRLVALTGYATPSDIERAHDAGFDAHLAKPPDLEKLTRVLSAADAD